MQAVDILIRRRILWRLVWICTVTLCSTNRKIGIYGLYNGFIASVKYIVDTDYKPADLDLCLLSNSFTMCCPPVRGDNPRALASGSSYVQVGKHGITILYHHHQCGPCTPRDISC